MKTEEGLEAEVILRFLDYILKQTWKKNYILESKRFYAFKKFKTDNCGIKYDRGDRSEPR